MWQSSGTVVLRYVGGLFEAVEADGVGGMGETFGLTGGGREGKLGGGRRIRLVDAVFVCGTVGMDLWWVGNCFCVCVRVCVRVVAGRLFHVRNGVPMDGWGMWRLAGSRFPFVLRY